ncbi:MAG: neutral/alkaline non-lysosomal ceramidase N-terminal domain-containing protein [Bacteroidales bacterium]|nr:neutral/alkaline non-lysosomal ceramidase N-terminal domain-containing protein [Bacteroidales bacterium]
MMNHLRKFILVFTANFVFLFALHASAIEANVAVIKLTPPLEMGYTLGGYGARMSKPAEGIHDDIWAKALVLNDGGKKFAIVTLDILGLPPNVKPQVIEKLNQEGWTEENIMLLPSHSHSSLEMFALNDKNIFGLAPIGIFQPQLLDFVVQSLADLIKSADQDLKPVKIGSHSKQIDGLNRNRRGEPFIDNSLTVTRIDYLNGKPMTVLVNWTGHPTIMDENDMLVSGGWPGYLQRELEGWIGQGVVAMFYNGPQGDQSVIAEGAGSHFEKAERYGRTMAINVLNIYNNINPVENIQFSYNYKIIPLPDREAHPDFMETGGKEYGLDEEKIKILLDQVFPVQTSIGAFRLGNLLIVGAPGELSAELGLNVKEKLKTRGVKYPAIGGLANQWISYILSENEYHKSGYEASVSFYGKDLGEVIVRGMMDTAIPLTK